MSGVMHVLREVEAKVLEDHQETGWLDNLSDVEPEFAGVLRKAALSRITENLEKGSVSWYDVAINGLFLAAAEVMHLPQREALIALIAVLVKRILDLDGRHGALVPAVDPPKLVEGTAHAELKWPFEFSIGEDECAA